MMLPLAKADCLIIREPYEPAAKAVTARRNSHPNSAWPAPARWTWCSWARRPWRLYSVGARLALGRRSARNVQISVHGVEKTFVGRKVG